MTEQALDSGGSPAATALSSECGMCHIDSLVDEADHRVIITGLEC